MHSNWANYSGKLDYVETKNESLLGSRSSGVGQNIREWWVGEKICVIDGNAIGLRWPSIVIERAEKNNEFEEAERGGI